MPTIQTSMEVFVLLLLLRLCKRFLGNYAQVGACVEVDNPYAKYCGGPPLPEYVGAYMRLLICRYLCLLVSEGSPLIFSIVMPHQNDNSLWK